MKHLKSTALVISLLFLFAEVQAQYSQLAEVISSGGGESTGGVYSNFGVIGETFVDCPVTGGSYDGSIGFLYASEGCPINVEEPTTLTNLTLYPNPNSGQFTIEMQLAKPQELEMEMLNVIGQVVYKEGLGKISGVYQKQLDLNYLAKGIYTLKLISEEGITTRKIVLE